MSNTVVGSWDLTVNKTRFLSFWNLYSDGRRWNVQNKRVYSLSNGDVCCGKKSSRIKEIRISLMSLCIHICVDSCACVCVRLRWREVAISFRWSDWQGDHKRRGPKQVLTLDFPDWRYH